MLQEITWSQFISVAITLTILWYAAVLLLFFRQEIRSLFTGKRKAEHPRPQADDPPESEVGDEETFDPIALTATPDGVDSIAPDELAFAPQLSAGSKEQSLGTVPDFIEEIKLLTDVLKREEGDKVSFHTMFAMLKDRYPAIRESGQLETLTSYLEEQLPFSLSEEEKTHLWD